MTTDREIDDGRTPYGRLGAAWAKEAKARSRIASATPATAETELRAALRVALERLSTYIAGDETDDADLDEDREFVQAARLLVGAPPVDYPHGYSHRPDCARTHPVTYPCREPSLVTRTPSPQTTEGLGATPLTAEEIERRVDGLCPACGGDGYTVTADPLPNGEPDEPYQVQCWDPHHALAEDIRSAARLSVPSEALAEARETVIAKARLLLADSGRTRAISEARTALDDALYEYDRILAALPNREDAPQPRQPMTGGPESEPDYDHPDNAPVREDAPSREGLDDAVAFVSALMSSPLLGPADDVPVPRRFLANILAALPNREDAPERLRVDPSDPTL